MEQVNGIIRKICIGDIKEGITYKKGQKMFGGVITIMDIVRDEAYHTHYGRVRYDIYVKKNNSEYTRLWKSFLDVPMTIEYDIEIEKNGS